MAAPLTVAEYVQGVLASDSATLARTITLLESRNLEHQRLAQQVLAELLAHSGGARRVVCFCQRFMFFYGYHKWGWPLFGPRNS